MFKSLKFPALVLGVSQVVSAVAQPRYELIDLGALPGLANTSSGACGVGKDGSVLGLSDRGPFRWASGAGFTFVGPGGYGQAANESGDWIAQVYGTTSGGPKFIGRNGEMASITPPSNHTGDVRDINDAGVVLCHDETVPFTWTRSNGAVALPVGDAVDCLVFNINNSDTIVGACSRDSRRPAFQGNPVYWQNGNQHYVDLPLGATGGYFRGVNDLGVTCCNAWFGENRRPYLWTISQGYTPVPLPPGIFGAIGRSISNDNVLTGVCWGPDGDRVFVYSPSWGFRLLEKLILPKNSGYVLADTQSINNRGQIAGTMIVKKREHAFLATPIR